jgi:hypothetical protein
MVFELTIALDLHLELRKRCHERCHGPGGSLNANDPTVEARPRPAEGRDPSLGQAPYLELSPIRLSSYPLSSCMFGNRPTFTDLNLTDARLSTPQAAGKTSDEIRPGQIRWELYQPYI